MAAIPAPSPADVTLREQILAVLWQNDPANTDPEDLADVLVPLVQREREAAAAKALTDAADDLIRHARTLPIQMVASQAVQWLRDRAAGTGRGDR